MAQDARFTLKIKVEHPRRVYEGDSFRVRYVLKNIGQEIFPGGAIDLRLSYMEYSGFSVIHYWPLESISINEEKILEPEAIRAVAGINAFIFLRCVSIGNVQNVLVVGINGRPLTSGSLYGMLTVKSDEERRSIRNMKITAISLFVLVIFQIFDWAYQTWLNDKTCIQNVIYVAFGLIPILLIAVYKEGIS